MATTGRGRPTTDRATITSLEFQNYKALKRYSLALQPMNVLVGPNNCGKSTIVGAFKILSAALRRAKARKPDTVIGPNGRAFGYELSGETLPVSLENSHTDYSDTDATITFRLSNSNRLQLFFNRGGGCVLLALPKGKPISTAAGFKAAYPIGVSVVPVLGPVEHQEEVLQRETVQRNLETHRASRHFRNYWYHFPENFAEFADMVARTWPGMQIEPPELISDRPPHLSMFCLEQRIARELFWAGSGFQIWCQLLTHIVNGRDSSVVVVDEPEIYLHPDVQRQLVGILRQVGADILVASHSPEIIGEADPSEIVLVDKKLRSGQRLRDVDAVQSVLKQIGSSQNITLTRLARNRRVLFVEDEYDFGVIRRFARQLEYVELATASEITAVRSEGFSSWERVQALGWGISRTLGQQLSIGAIFDRDYWCDEQIGDVLSKLRSTITYAHIHDRKEIENYLLVPSVLTRAIDESSRERLRRGEASGVSGPPTEEDVRALLAQLTDPLRGDVQAQHVARRLEFLRKQGSKLDPATITAETIAIFERRWLDIGSRMEIVPGKDVLSAFRAKAQSLFSVTLTDHRIIGAFRRGDVPADLTELIADLDHFRRVQPA